MHVGGAVNTFYVNICTPTYFSAPCLFSYRCVLEIIPHLTERVPSYSIVQMNITF